METITNHIHWLNILLKWNQPLTTGLHLFQERDVCPMKWQGRSEAAELWTRSWGHGLSSWLQGYRAAWLRQIPQSLPASGSGARAQRPLLLSPQEKLHRVKVLILHSRWQAKSKQTDQHKVSASGRCQSRTPLRRSARGRRGAGSAWGQQD